MQDATSIRIEHSMTSNAQCAYFAARSMWLAATVSVLAACAVHAASPAAPTDETIVRVYPSTVVGGDDVLLSDIAEVTGESAKLVSNCPVAAAPAPGRSRSIELTRVQDLLARRGVNLSRWIFRGATRCTITRPDNGTSGTHMRHPSDGAAYPVSAKATSSADAAGRVINPNSLEALLQKHLTQRLTSLGGTPVIQFNPAIQKLLALSQPTYRFRIADCGDRLLGLVSLEVTIFE